MNIRKLEQIGWIRRVIAPVVWLHEFMHFATARALGAEATIRGDETIREMTESWKDIVITLAPVVPGVILFVWSLIGWANTGWGMSHPELAWSCGVWVGFWWVGMCYYDFASVWGFLRSGEWPNEIKEDG